MTEGVSTAGQEANLSSLVREAFIDPIRSVLIIDDEYPTWEHVFGAGFNVEEKGRWKERSDINALISQFRQKSKALTIDIHDGVDNTDIGTYLHQSDLLVLDYQLEKGGLDGVRAVGIMKSLFENRHFNLVVMHTAATDLFQPFTTVLDALLRPLPEVTKLAGAGQTLIEEAEGNEEDVPEMADLWAKLRGAVSRQAHFLYRQHAQKGTKAANFVRVEPALAAFRAICEAAKWTVPQQAQVFCRTVQLYEDNLGEGPDRPLDLRWSAPGQSRRPWIRTPGGFIAFAGKSDPQLLTALGEAIEDWKPSPSRMISSKIRAAISGEGAYAEESALSDKHVYWQYYDELLRSPAGEAGNSHRKSLLEAHTSRHTERLLDVVGGSAIAFGMRLIDCDPGLKNGKAEGFGSHYNVTFKSDADRLHALYRYNSYISTKPVSGWHLQPGQVLEVDDKLWVCVSPACDLVPNQKGQAAISGSIKASVKPFMAVQLHYRAQRLSRDEINSNTFVFLSGPNEEVKAYSAYSDPGQNASPTWRLFNASDFGKFSVDPTTKTAPIRLQYLCGLSGELAIETRDSCVIAQLRYEYALNLIQKLGVEMTRVGLDFISPA